MVSKESIKLVVETLSHQGVNLKNMDTTTTPPQYFVEVDRSRLLTSLEDTLKSAYGVLWTLTYGKLSDSNRENTIDLKYKEVGAPRDSH